MIRASLKVELEYRDRGVTIIVPPVNRSSKRYRWREASPWGQGVTYYRLGPVFWSTYPADLLR